MSWHTHGAWQVSWYENKKRKYKTFEVRDFMKTSQENDAEADALRAAIEFRKCLERSGIAKARRAEKPQTGCCISYGCVLGHSVTHLASWSANAVNAVGILALWALILDGVSNLKPIWCFTQIGRGLLQVKGFKLYLGDMWNSK